MSPQSRAGTEATAEALSAKLLQQIGLGWSDLPFADGSANGSWLERGLPPKAIFRSLVQDVVLPVLQRMDQSWWVDLEVRYKKPTASLLVVTANGTQAIPVAINPRSLKIGACVIALGAPNASDMALNATARSIAGALTSLA